MTEELQGALTEILNGALSAKDFMLAELPEVVQQLLLWKFWYYLITGCIGILCIAGCILTVLKTYKFVLQKLEELEPVFLGYIVLIPALIYGFHAINIKWLQIWLAPKVYLIEYAASLAK